MSKDKIQSGAVVDIRPPEKKEKDYKFQEIVASANAIDWTDKVTYREFPIFNQGQSSSCVAQTQAKEMGVMRWLKDGEYVHFSATDIYQRRKNRPATGMWAVDARDIIAKGGATLEALVPSQNLTDQEMDGEVVEEYKREVGEVFKIPNYIELPLGDIDTIASVIETTGKAVMVWFYFESREWTDYPTVMNDKLKLEAPATIRHAVAAVDYLYKNGKKYLVIEDSAHFNGFSRRFIDEDFLKARNWYSGYLMNFQFDSHDSPTPKPTHTFKETLRFTPEYSINADVKALQDILKYEGLFPANVASTGYYGAITAKAVLAWQIKHSVASQEELESLQGKVVGPKTRAVLNAKYQN